MLDLLTLQAWLSESIKIQVLGLINFKNHIRPKCEVKTFLHHIQVNIVHEITTKKKPT